MITVPVGTEFGNMGKMHKFCHIFVLDSSLDAGNMTYSMSDFNETWIVIFNSNSNRFNKVIFTTKDENKQNVYINFL